MSGLGQDGFFNPMKVIEGDNQLETGNFREFISVMFLDMVFECVNQMRHGFEFDTGFIG